MGEAEISCRPGVSFEHADVVRNYIYRPPYPDALYDRLFEISPGLNAALDIGAGPGKIARTLAGSFALVCALDPSSEMIAQGKALPGGNASNLQWVEGLAEEFQGEQTFDLIVAAASIHWMDHARLFPKLSACARPDCVFAVVSGGDVPFDPAWKADWHQFLGKWVPILTGHPFDHEKREREQSSYQDYLDQVERETVVSEPVTQSVADFVRCQHSRNTFAPHKLGALKQAFDAELTELLKPYATDGHIKYRTSCALTSGRIRPGRIAN